MARVLLRRDELEAGNLPSVCARCGASADPTWISLPYVPPPPGRKVPPELGHFAHFPLAALFASVLGLWVIVHGLLYGRRLRLWLPLCEQHQKLVRWYEHGLSWCIRVLAALGVALIVPAVSTTVSVVRQGANPNDDVLVWLFWSSVVGFLLAALFFRARAHDNFIAVLTVTDEKVELTGIDDRFVWEMFRKEAEGRT